MAPLIAGGILLALASAGLIRPLFTRNTFTVEAALYRQRPGTKERIASGGQVQPGDRLFLEFKGSKPLHVYVLNEDERGNTYLLFPLAGVEPANPVSPGGPHRLPGSLNGVPQTWEVDSYGGHETLLFVASREPLKNLESQMERLRQPETTGPAGRSVPDPGTSRLLRGIGRLAPVGPAGSDASGRLAEIYKSLGMNAENVRGIWVQQIQLENPGPGR